MRRAVVVAGGLVLLGLAGAVVTAGHRAERSGRATAAGSSFRADEAGHRAARLLLESVGFPVRSRRGAQLPSGAGHVLLRVAGLPGVAEDVPERERAAVGQALADWVERGNAVLLLAAATPPGTGFPAIRERFQVPDDLLPGIGPPAPPPEAELLEEIFGARPDVPAGGGDVVEEHAFDELGDPWITPYHVVVARAADHVLASRVADGEAQPVVVESSRGRGAVLVVADPWFATNVGLARGDNAAWLAVLVQRLLRGGEVWIDDRAVGQTATRGVLSLFQEAGFGPALAAGFVLLLLVWWRVGPSDAPDRLARPRRDYRPEAYAELRAGLYASCMDDKDVRRAVRNEVARRLGRGDATSFDRALSLLRTRDPERAARVDAALEGLPRHGDVTVARHPGTWSASVARIWRALGSDGGEDTRTVTEGPEETT